MIRKAERRDAATIATLAAEINEELGEESTKMPTEVVLRDGFGDAPAFAALIAEIDNQPVGLAMYHHAYETEAGMSGLYLSELYVRPAFRRRGVARALIAAAARETQRQGRGFLWWAADQDNDEAIALYRKVAVKEDPAVAFAVFGSRLSELAREAGDD